MPYLNFHAKRWQLDLKKKIVLFTKNGVSFGKSRLLNGAKSGIKNHQKALLPIGEK